MSGFHSLTSSILLSSALLGAVVVLNATTLAESATSVIGRSAARQNNGSKTEEVHLTKSDAKISCALSRGVTSFIICLASQRDPGTITVENENQSAEGKFTIAVANNRLEADDPNWSSVGDAIPFRHKRLFALSLVGIDMRYVRLTFVVDGPEMIAAR